MSDEEMLRQIKTQTLTLIESLTTTPKPTYSIDGQAVSWGAYLAQLQATVEWCDRQLTVVEPFELHSRGYT